MRRLGIQSGGFRNMRFLLVTGAWLAESPCYAVSIRSTMNASIGLFRSVHNTSKKNHTSLITADMKHSSFHKMSLNALKNECRSRGLKVSGKKAELIDRIMTFNGSSGNKAAKMQRMSTASPVRGPTAAVKLKVPTSSIEMCKTREVSTASGKLDFQTKSFSPLNINSATDSAIATDTQATKQADLRDNIVMGDELTWRDRLFLAGFATVALLWWGAQSSEKETG
ncbi:hypothetical protein HG536_0H04440 [Torulaspora globosa]|uniref:SAP domain-containing protein n=1 Tax=Torulaspora globosa TaxID=48254 RepID=A0A7G3ZNI2_9SACH|nr:uncharacterized protein HG536_0H04440 [Torulaspora globosa]QLL35068.1 hypothetical protein HG536_0H04440 [Torulaspora globosa]